MGTDSINLPAEGRRLAEKIETFNVNSPYARKKAAALVRDLSDEVQRLQRKEQCGI